jgi:hypothetical protein
LVELEMLGQVHFAGQGLAGTDFHGTEHLVAAGIHRGSVVGFHDKIQPLEAAVAAALGDPWRWAVREVGEGGIWQGHETPDEAHQCAVRWTADGIECEVVPLYVGEAVQR